MQHVILLKKENLLKKDNVLDIALFIKGALHKELVMVESICTSQQATVLELSEMPAFTMKIVIVKLKIPSPERKQ